MPDIQLEEHVLNISLLYLDYRLSKHEKSLVDFSGMPVARNTFPTQDVAQVRGLSDFHGYVLFFLPTVEA
ncbi:hypothetical protein LOD99_10896 [Oopsacas minuta]|uniref:Uncharacterized protein n=1 Tax=Oopsacas minuta TaxID=111878 RepID=A0AAV7KCH5_9METZ|nr:hypothetical protein LOD99_10896 [Oopsacas minuta]